MREFNGIGAFIAHLAAIDGALHRQMEHALEKSAEAIEDAAKAQLGTYQPAVGPFPAWVPLAEATKTDRERQGFAPDNPLLRDGSLIRDSIQHEVHGLDAVVGSKEDVAAYQEFGTSRIPPRPFMGPAAVTAGKEIREIVGTGLAAAFVGDLTLPGRRGE